MIGTAILFVLLLSLGLGLLALGVQLLWHSPSQIPLYLRFILFGFLVALCMLGLLILGNHSACLLTISC